MDRLLVAGVAILVAGLLYLAGAVDMAGADASPLAFFPFALGILLAGVGLVMARRAGPGRKVALAGFALAAAAGLRNVLDGFDATTFSGVLGLAWLVAIAGAAVLAFAAWRWDQGADATLLFRIGAVMMALGEVAPVLAFSLPFDPLFFGTVGLPGLLLVVGLAMLALSPPPSAPSPARA